MSLGAAGKGLVALLVIAVAVSLAMLFGGGGRPIGSEHLIGMRLPDFAAPLAGSGVRGDANVYTPAQAKSRHATAACDVRRAGTVNSCDALRGAAVLVFWNAGKRECVQQVGNLQRALAAAPHVSGLALAFGDSEGEAARVARREGWRLPVAADPDGAVAALYSVAGCPSIFFARDGVIRGVKLGLQTTPQLTAEIERHTGG